MIDVGVLNTDFPESFLQVVHVFFYFRSDKGVEHCSAEPLVLAELFGEIAGDGQEHLWQRLLNLFSEQPFVFRIQVCVEEHDGNGFCAAVFDFFQQFPDCKPINRPDHLPLVVHPLLNFKAKAAINQRPDLVCLQVIEVGSFLSADFQQITKSPCSNQCGFCSPSLQDRIGGYRRPMHETTDFTAVKPMLLCNDFDASNHSI